MTASTGRQAKDPAVGERITVALTPKGAAELGSVTNLIGARKTHPALGVNDTKWLHVDFTPGRRTTVWQRGSDDNPVVVVANFSDFQTDDPFNPSSEYVVPKLAASGRLRLEGSFPQPECGQRLNRARTALSLGS